MTDYNQLSSRSKAVTCPHCGKTVYACPQWTSGDCAYCNKIFRFDAEYCGCQTAQGKNNNQKCNQS